MSNGIKPPVVWHLDTARIEPFSYNPRDRLTMIKLIMQVFESGKAPLQPTLIAFEAVCDNKFAPQDLEDFLDEWDPDRETLK